MTGQYMPARRSSSEDYELLLPSTTSIPRKRSNSNAITFLAVLAFLLVSAVLSIGPAVTKIRSYVGTSNDGNATIADWSPTISLNAKCESTVARDRFICKHERSLRAYTIWQRTQSTTPTEAVLFYIRRYGRQPPPGFEQWVQFALDNNSTLIDEYDQIEADLAPHRAIKGNTLRSRVKGARQAWNTTVISLLQVQNGKVSYDRQDEPNFKDVLDLLEPVQKDIPNLKVLLNWDDRPMTRVGQPVRTDMNRVVWNATSGLQWLTDTCPKSIHTVQKGPVFEFRPDLNLCDRKVKNIEDKHGSFQTGGAAFPYTVPVLSTARFSVSSDIVVPHVVYAQNSYRAKEEDPIPFENKSDSIYWRGSNSGQHNRLDNWNKGQRPRFVLNMLSWKNLSAKLKNGSLTVDQAASSKEAKDHSLDIEGVKSLSKLDPSMFDALFSRMVYCLPDKVPCDKLTTAAPLAKWTSPSESLKHKFLFDLDGNGMSGRFYRLLEGNSLVFKQTVFSEWHDDRLVPWVHYIPIDLDFTDLPQLLEFLTQDDRGKEIASSIANRSKHWVKTSLRSIDMTLYYYRLMLEYGALYNAP